VTIEFVARGENSLEVHNAVRFNPIPESAHISTTPIEVPDTRLIYCEPCAAVITAADIDPLHLWHTLKPIKQRESQGGTFVNLGGQTVRLK
jgi:hypothetical protein